MMMLSIEGNYVCSLKVKYACVTTSRIPRDLVFWCFLIRSRSNYVQITYYDEIRPEAASLSDERWVSGREENNTKETETIRIGNNTPQVFMILGGIDYCKRSNHNDLNDFRLPKNLLSEIRSSPPAGTKCITAVTSPPQRIASGPGR